MNCCNNNNNNKNHNDRQKKGHMSHMWMMLLCCGLPIILLAAVSLLGAALPGVRSVLYKIIPFICPIMMIGMIPMMFRRGANNEKNGSENRLQGTNSDLPEK